VKCPFCSHAETRVVNSRPDREGNTIRRRRECEACPERFTTHETREEITPGVLKKKGTQQLYSRSKLIQSLQSAVNKRPVKMDEIISFVEELERSMQDQFRAEITSREIGDRVMAFLRERDQVAYVRFASVYRDFRDVGEFVDAISGLQDAAPEPDPEDPA